jgi:hypothetical protein
MKQSSNEVNTCAAIQEILCFYDMRIIIAFSKELAVFDVLSQVI